MFVCNTDLPCALKIAKISLLESIWYAIAPQIPIFIQIISIQY
jgi:hypothetical protein